MGKSSADEMILSYNDVVLRRSDLGILSGHHYLNDRLIEFYFSYLSSCYPSEDILLVTPTISFWISNCPDIDSVKDFVQSLNLPDKKLVIFPVNNNDDMEKVEGGSHWSLLVFERDTNVFVHHDSLGGLNEVNAKRLYEAVVPYMGISNMTSNGIYLQCANSPQQDNGYDCGLYVTAIARVICAWYERGFKNEEGLWFSSVNERVTPSIVSKMRSEILGLIRSLRDVK